MLSDLSVHRPRVFRAPSWSWASIMGKIAFPNMGSNIRDEIASVVSVTTSSISESPFGQLDSGRLVLNGPCIDAVYRTDSNHTDLAVANDEYKTTAELIPDYDFSGQGPHSVLPGSQIRIIWISRGFQGYFFMVLRRLNSDAEEFERIGHLRLVIKGSGIPLQAISHPAFFNHFNTTAQHKEIVIV